MDVRSSCLTEWCSLGQCKWFPANKICSNRCFFLGAVQKSVLCTKTPALHCLRHKERLTAEVANDHATHTKMHVIQVIWGLLWVVPRVGFNTVFCARVMVCTADSGLTKCDMQRPCTLSLPFDEWKRLHLALYKCIVAHSPSLLVQLASTAKCLYLGLPHSARSPSRRYQKSCSTASLLLCAVFFHWCFPSFFYNEALHRFALPKVLHTAVLSVL